MITKRRKGAETRRDAVRRQFREQADRESPEPSVRVLDGHGRPRQRPRKLIVPLPAKA